jgi:hypothetical protein
MKDISLDELATIRIALLDKIDNIMKYIRTNQEQQNIIGVKYWQEALDRHTTLLDKLY